MKLKKYENNPILCPGKNSWEERCVLNPAAIYDEKNKKFIMLYRAAGNDVEHVIRLGLAESQDGIHFARMSDQPVFGPSADGLDAGCVEDPRLVRMGDLFYLTYASRAFHPGQYWLPNAPFPPIYLDKGDVYSKDLPSYASRNITASFLAVTKDFRHYKRLGRLTEAAIDDRDVVLFPQKVGGRFVLLTRPHFENNPNVKAPSIWISFRDDLLEYTEPKLLMKGEQWWETARIGSGTPPILTEKGWLLLYHGVDDKGTYRVGALLLDKDHPDFILARSKDFIMEPSEPFELDGIYNGCVFPTGAVLKDGLLYVYYGCADKQIGLAAVPLKDLLAYLVRYCSL